MSGLVASVAGIGDTRIAARWANYNGDCRGNLLRVVGPNTLGEYLHIVTEDYDASIDTTRVGFAYGLPATPFLPVRVDASHSPAAVQSPDGQLFAKDAATGETR